MPPKKQTPPSAPEKTEATAPEAEAVQPEAVEPTPEETQLADRHGITVEALRALRVDLGTAVAAVESRARKAADICGICLPGGWPNDHADHADCPHGTWKR